MGVFFAPGGKLLACLGGDISGGGIEVVAQGEATSGFLITEAARSSWSSLRGVDGGSRAWLEEVSKYPGDVSS